MSRTIYTKAKLGEITQGSIISGATSDVYGDVDIYGVVISARCAIAERKVRTYHYIPLIPFSKFKENDFIRLCVEELINDYKSKIKGLLKNNNLSMSIVDVFTPRDIQRTLQDKIHKKNKDKLIEYTDVLAQLIDGQYLSPQIQELIKKHYNSIISKLCKHGYVDYYLMEGWPDSEEKYYVLLLQEIKAIPNEIFFQIPNGIETDRIRTVCSKCDLSIAIDNGLYFVQAQILSPYIEHIIQRFHYNFGRIGVKDLQLELTTEELNNILS